MGLREYFGFGVVPRPRHQRSPWSEGELQKIVYADIYGTNYAPLTREDAMSIPAFSKARDLLTNAAGQSVLVDVDDKTVTPRDKQPAWLYKTEGAISPYLRMAWTADDLLHYGHSLWGKRLDANGRYPLAAWRIPYDDWGINERGLIFRKSDNYIYQDEEIIYIPGHTQGVLDRAGSTLRAAIAIGKAVEFRTAVPIPVMEISITADGEIEDEEAEELVKSYNAARANPDGATVVTPRGVELKPHGDRADSGFMVEGRNAVRLDMGNITGVPGSLLDGSTATATLTYSTTDGKRNEFHEFAVAPYINCIIGRFSQDDLSASGHHVEVDYTNQNAAIPAAIDTTRQD